MKFQTKNDLVFTALWDAISSGELAPGDWIRTAEWAEKLDVSQTPVREALRRLEAQGLVEILPHRGARVTSHTLEHIVETFHIRMALESLAARLAIERSDDEEFRELVARTEALTSEMEEAVARNDVTKCRQMNQELHFTLYRAAKMPRLLALIEGLWVTYPFDTLNLQPDRPRQTLTDHWRLLEVMKRRDPQEMARAMEEHLRSGLETLLRTMPDARGGRGQQASRLARHA